MKTHERELIFFNSLIPRALIEHTKILYTCVLVYSFCVRVILQFMAIFHNIESHKKCTLNIILAKTWTVLKYFYNLEKNTNTDLQVMVKVYVPTKKNRGWLRHSNFLKIWIYNITLSPNHNKFCGHVLPNPPPKKKKNHEILLSYWVNIKGCLEFVFTEGSR